MYLDDVVIHDLAPVRHVAQLATVVWAIRGTQPETNSGEVAHWCHDCRNPEAVHYSRRSHPNPQQEFGCCQHAHTQGVCRLRSAPGELKKYRQHLPNPARIPKPLTTLLKREIKSSFVPTVKKTVQNLLAQLCSDHRSSYIPIGTPVTTVFASSDCIPTRARLDLGTHQSRGSRLKSLTVSCA